MLSATAVEGHAHPGEEMVRALNGNADAQAQVERAVGQAALATPFRAMVRHVRTRMTFECTGWSRLEAVSRQACFLAGLVHRQDENGRTCVKLVSAAGESWLEAAFLLLCEAAERHAQLGFADAADCPGTAFGLTPEGASLRAVLERLERFHFKRTFHGRLTPITLDVRADAYLGEFVACLAMSQRDVGFFLLTAAEPFHVVLAVHTASENGGAGRLACGLSCGYDLAALARKALLEALKSDLYIQTGNIETDIRAGAMKEQARRTISFWSDKENWNRLAFLTGGPRKSIGPAPAAAVTDAESLSRLLTWCDRAGMGMRCRPLLVPRAGQDGWVYQAIGDGLPDVCVPADQSPPSPLF